MRWFVPVLTALVVIAAMFWFASAPEATLCEPPDVHLGELEGFRAERQSGTEIESSMLPKDTQIERMVYTAPDGNWYVVTQVVGGRDKGSIHRPELCLPAQGFLMTSPRTLFLDGVSWRAITLAGKDGHDLGLAYTFYNQDGFRTSSHVRRIFRDVWDRSFFNRIDRWTMLTVYTSVHDDYRLSLFLTRLKGVVECSKK